MTRFIYNGPATSATFRNPEDGGTDIEVHLFTGATVDRPEIPDTDPYVAGLVAAGLATMAPLPAPASGKAIKGAAAPATPTA